MHGTQFCSPFSLRWFLSSASLSLCAGVHEITAPRTPVSLESRGIRQLGKQSWAAVLPAHVVLGCMLGCKAALNYRQTNTKPYRFSSLYCAVWARTHLVACNRTPGWRATGEAVQAAPPLEMLHFSESLRNNTGCSALVLSVHSQTENNVLLCVYLG